MLTKDLDCLERMSHMLILDDVMQLIILRAYVKVIIHDDNAIENCT